MNGLNKLVINKFKLLGTKYRWISVNNRRG